MLEDLTPPVRSFPCGVREMINSLEEPDRVILRDALANTMQWSHRALSKALTDKGLNAGEKLIRERRLKACADCICR